MSRRKESLGDLSTSLSKAESSQHDAIYKPLDSSRSQTRLLVVEAGTYGDDIRGTLQLVSLDPEAEKAQYEAISYCWGDTDKRAYIFLNGCRVKTPISAATALRYLRLPDSSRTLWIDALCINQDDVKERESQVTLMGKIYQNATRTVVWLGEADNEVEAVIQIIENAGKDIPPEARGSNWAKRNISDYWKDLPSPILDLESVVAILGRPWFSRLWVFQEVALSTNCVIQVGRFVFDWEDLEIFAARLVTNPPNKQDSKHVFKAITATLYIRPVRLDNTTRSLSFLVESTRNLAAKDPRDKIYGLLGLNRTYTKGQNKRRILPKYDIAVRVCIMDAVRFMIEEENNLNGMVDFPRMPLRNFTQDQSWPSWCPRYDIAQPENYPPPRTEFLSPDYHADGLSPSKLKALDPTRHPDELCVGGILVSFVSKAEKSFGDKEANIVISAQQTMRSVMEAASHEHAALIFITMLAGNLNGRKITMEDDRFRAFLGIYRQMEDSWNDPESAFSDPKIADEFLRVLRTIHKACHNRCLFQTANGYTGLGPADMQEKDEVAILFGLRWPVILRPRGDFYELIQPCYIHGIMEGEAVREWEASGEEVKFFALR